MLLMLGVTAGARLQALVSSLELMARWYKSEKTAKSNRPIYLMQETQRGSLFDHEAEL